MAGVGSLESASDASLCANNCGFYGTAKNQNLCSICYTAFLKQKLVPDSSSEDFQQPESVDVVNESGNLCSDSIEIQFQELDLGTKPSSPSRLESSVTSGSIGSMKAAAKQKNRCMICKKKVGLLGFNCRCDGLFCGKHRYPEEHSCKVDLQAIGKAILAEQNVECKGDKLDFRV